MIIVCKNEYVNYTLRRIKVRKSLYIKQNKEYTILYLN